MTSRRRCTIAPVRDCSDDALRAAAADLALRVAGLEDICAGIRRTLEMQLLRIAALQSQVESLVSIATSTSPLPADDSLTRKTGTDEDAVNRVDFPDGSGMANRLTRELDASEALRRQQP
jgi:hypothetical protein